MKTATLFLVAALGLAMAAPALAQLEVASYDRVRPIIFCGQYRLSDPQSVPFDLRNTGSAAVTIDSVIATGDTADFYSNHVVATNEPYLNPVLWKYINGRTIEPGASSFTNFFFNPGSIGAKQLTITVHYHDAGGVPMTAQGTIHFRTTDVSAPFGFLAIVVDTIRYTGGITSTAVTYDRTIVTDTLTVIDTVRLGDTLRASLALEDRIDLTTCGGVTVTEVERQQESSDDIFLVFYPIAPYTLQSGASTTVDFMYVPLSTETVGRQAFITFRTAEGHRAVLRLVIVTPGPSDVEDEEPVGDERGVITLLRGGIESMPNPFSGGTTIRTSFARAGHARLTVVNALGEEVALLLDESVEAGVREIPFAAAGLPSGTYFARLSVSGRVLTHELKIQH
jgi:hypothetical protein